VKQNAHVTSTSVHDENHRRNAGIAGRVINAVVGPLVNPVVDQVDIDEVVNRIDLDHLLQRIDLDQVLERVDLDALVDRLDMDALLERVDPNRLLDRIDLNRLLGRVDIDQVASTIDINALVDRVNVDNIVNKVNVDDVVAKVDLNAVLQRVDLNPVIERVDMNAVLERVDLDPVIERVDMNAVLERVDVNAIVGRVDAVKLVEQTEIGALITKSTSGILLRVLDVLRSYVMSVDAATQMVVNGIMRRPRAERPTVADDASGSDVRWARVLALQDNPAGHISRIVAFAIDLFMIQLLFGLGESLFSTLWELFTGRTWEARDHRILAGIILIVLAFAYFAVPLAVSGRTLGKSIMGLKVRPVGGGELTGKQAAIRTLTLPLSFLLLFVGAFMALLRVDHRALHDVIGGTQEVYAWDARAGHLRALAQHATV
jgi:uncharacterized RDD family membrane protein YckC